MKGKPSSSKEEDPKPDSIDRLPDCLLVQILSLLPFKEAIRSCILSKQWRYRWTSLCNVAFDFPGSRLPDRVDSIDTILTGLGDSIVKRFSVCIEYDKWHASDVNRWVQFAVEKKHVEEFTLELKCGIYNSIVCYTRYQLPQYIYWSSSLTKLRLVWCNVRPWPRCTISWDLLKSLTIGRTRLGNNLLRMILSGCPKLEYLELFSCWGFKKLESPDSLRKLVIGEFFFYEHEDDLSDLGCMLDVSAPNIKSLDISGEWNRKFRVTKAPEGLVDATLTFEINRYCEHYNQRPLLEILTSLRKVKNLTIGPWCIQVLTLVEAEGTTTLGDSTCTSLVLISEIKDFDLLGIQSLLRSSPDLETLVLNMAPSMYPEFGDPWQVEAACKFSKEKYWNPENIPKCLTKHLKTIKIYGYSGEHNQFHYVRFLLQYAIVLERMVLSNVDPSGEYNSSHDYDECAMLQRSSDSSMHSIQKRWRSETFTFST
ncbi:hypothetical protein RJ640_017642 [Escallonia rubra]|uniref:FBD domain-containing protein n=1 Tax=Escallonia rubra TaxID=112253 RepID=A0AA88QVF5_9ASTE|nr:hypothetical protein RJ640_017642 [Escallonia rubra]